MYEELSHQQDPHQGLGNRELVLAGPDGIQWEQADAIICRLNKRSVRVRAPEQDRPSLLLTRGGFAGLTGADGREDFSALTVSARLDMWHLHLLVTGDGPTGNKSWKLCAAQVRLGPGRPAEWRRSANEWSAVASAWAEWASSEASTDDRPPH